jgi:hypothetical protein
MCCEIVAEVKKGGRTKKDPVLKVALGKRKDQHSALLTITDLYGQIFMNVLVRGEAELDASRFRPGEYYLEAIVSRQVVRIPVRL